MAVSGISGTAITGTLSNGSYAMQQAKTESEYRNFASMVESLTANAKQKEGDFQATTNLSSSQVSKGKRLNGDYTQGFAGTYTSESDKHSKPKGAAAQAYYGNNAPEIDRTSELYEQAMEFENYMVKMMLSSMRSTIQKSDLMGKENSYAREMYEDMLYDNYAEQLTKGGNFGLADQIYLQLSGQR